MIIKSDWHVHSEYSYDAKISLETIGDNAKVQGLINVGITDHLNFNDQKFTTDLINSVNGVKKAQEKYPFMVLGVELTPIEKPEFDYILTHPDHEGYVAPIQEQPFDIELGMSKENLKKLGVRYAIGASHWRVDKPNGRYMPIELDASIKEWHRQQMWLANDERVTILGHPWYHGNGIWYQDFSIIPSSMNDELISELKQNGKFMECNSHFFCTKNATEKFRIQYAEFLRLAYEKGVKITYGSDAHDSYSDERIFVEPYLEKVGFKEGDFYDLTEKDFW